MLELIVSIALISLAAGAVLHYQRRADDERQRQQIVQLLSEFVAATRRIYLADGTYNQARVHRVYQAGLVQPPLTYYLPFQQVHDPWEGVIEIYGNAAGAARSFSLFYYSLTSERCIAFASALASGADVVTLGSTAMPTDGLATGGRIYKAADGQLNPSNLTAGCAEASPRIALQYH